MGNRKHNRTYYPSRPQRGQGSNIDDLSSDKSLLARDRVAMADPTELVSGPEEEVTFEPKDVISRTVEVSLTTGAAGLFLSTVQNTLSRQQVGVFGVFSRYGGTTVWATGAGASYAFISTASGNLREKEDFWNHFYGGAATGALLGLRRRTFPSVIGTALFAGAVMGGLSFAGGQVYATGETPEERIARKEEHRRRFRRPYQEMVNEIGEGRGIYPPGYNERRAQRISDNYGIEVQPPYYERKKQAGIETSAI